jgi:uncharacterized protein YbaR (Trm112 family)
MIDDDLLELLACPVTRQPLARADGALVERLNRAIRDGRLSNVGGEAQSTAVEAALVRQDGQVAYPIVDGIPVLLADEGLPVPRG